ncbi:CaiB/BaiF CoA transferase family protein [Sphingorhabdus sp.]|uniref:CaiB/BaiF CoA transferase family protein n=1 Tax=Sphingorhabdus sp. TaxID=1902408 RepID=UPI0035AF9698|nr:CoA transferase [Sphingomonadaceae bacterium]
MIADNAGALKDLKVIEMGQLIAGPFCGQLLGDMGADVVKIEPPEVGDPMRQWGNGEHKVWWDVIGRNKRSVTANLRVAEGQALARQLLADADVMIENFKPGTVEKWGLGPAELHAINPRLIIVRMSGYGQTGPYSSRAGFGGIGEAMGGWRAIVGDPDRPPARMGVSIGDTLCATYGCMGVLAALHARERSGKGQVIDSALYEAVLQVMESLVPEYDVSGIVRQRSGSILPGIAPSNVYRCKDGEFMIGGNGDAIFARLADAMGQPELASDARFATHAARGANQAELDRLINDWTAGLGVDEVESLMVAHSVPAGRVFTGREILSDPHIAAREAVVAVEHPLHGQVRMQAPMPRLSDTPSSVRRPASRRPGEHNAEIYGERLGLDAAALAALAARGII